MKRQPPPSRLRSILKETDTCTGSYDVPHFAPYNRTTSAPWLTVKFDKGSYFSLPYDSNLEWVGPRNQTITTSSTVTV